MRNNQNWENIPEEIKKECVFCTHQNKIPNARTNDKTTFKKFDEVINERKSSEGVGIGIFDNVCGIDIDHCINEKGEISKEAKEIIELFNSYTEKSPSGTGIHILFKNENQEEIDKIKYFTKNSKSGIELYQGKFDNRFLTCTGNKIQGDYISINPDVIKKFNEKYMKKPEMIQPTIQRTSSDDYKTDREFLSIGLQKDVKLQELLKSTPSGSGGNESETDLKIMCKLAYWTNCNEMLMNETFIESSYFRMKDNKHQEKWNNRKDYSRETIKRAIQQTTTTARDDNQQFIEKQKQIQEKKEEQEQKQQEEKKKTIEDFMLKNAKNQFQSFCEKSSRGEFKPIPTGFQNLDEILCGGFLKQSIVCIGGGSSVGKTSIALNIVLQMLKQGKKIVYYTLEMSEEQILAKIYSNIAYTTQTDETRGIKVESNDFFKMFDENIFTDTRKRLVQKAIEKRTELENLFVINETSNLDELIEHTNYITEFFKENNEEPPILFVDYLQFIRGKSREDVQSIIKRATKFFKDYAIKNNTIVVILTANNRQSTEEKTKTTFSGGRDSSDIEYSFDYNLQINFAEWELQEGGKKEQDQLRDRATLINLDEKEMTLTIHKLRMGKGGGIAVFNYIGSTNTFIPKEEEKNNEIEINGIKYLKWRN